MSRRRPPHLRVRTMRGFTLVELLVVFAIVALLAVGGLIPFWIYIFFLYNPR